MSTADLKTLISDIETEAEEYVSSRPEATLIVGLTVRGERHVRSFRSPDAKHAPLPDASSVYEIGSVSKVLSATLLATLETQGLLALDDPISAHLPQSLRLSPEIGSLTIRQLATHTSGLGPAGKRHQRLIAEEQRGTEPPWGTYTHYLRYRKEDLYADLEDAELEYPTGEGWIYSIIGMGTVLHLAELVTGTPYEELLQQLVCGPLGLKDTGYSLSEEQLGRFVHAYDSEGQPLPNWYHDVLLPQGGLRSTVADLLTFVEANIRASVEPDGSALAAALRRTREQHGPLPAGLVLPDQTEPAIFDQGLAWRGLPRPDGRAAWHPGTTLFYLADAAVDEHARVGLAAISSQHRSLGDMHEQHALRLQWFQRLSQLTSPEQLTIQP